MYLDGLKTRCGFLPGSLFRRLQRLRRRLRRLRQLLTTTTTAAAEYLDAEPWIRAPGLAICGGLGRGPMSPYWLVGSGCSGNAKPSRVVCGLCVGGRDSQWAIFLNLRLSFLFFCWDMARRIPPSYEQMANQTRGKRGKARERERKRDKANQSDLQESQMGIWRSLGVGMGGGGVVAT